MFSGAQNVPVAPGTGGIFVPSAGMPSGITDPSTLLPIDPFFGGDDSLSTDAPPAQRDTEVIILGPLGSWKETPAVPMQPVTAPEATETKKIDPLPEPILNLWQRLERFFANLTGQRWSPELVPLSPNQATAIFADGNPFGIHSNGKGHWIYPSQQKDAIIAHLHRWRVAEQDGGILRLALSGSSHPLLLFPEIPIPTSTPRVALDYAPLRPTAAQAKPIVFYHEDATFGGSGGTKPGVTQWVHAMRGLGYNIIYVGSQPELGRVLHEVRPDIVLVSAIENLLPYAHAAYFEAKAANPGAITVLGGFAAIPEFAHFYDIVMRGESEIALPMVLARLLSMLAEGRMEPVEPAPWGSMVAGLDDFLSAAGRPGWVTEFIEGRPSHYPPVLSAEAAAELTSLSGTRYVDAGDAQFALGVPIGYDPRTQETRVFVRSTGGTISATPQPVDPRLMGAQTRWRQLMPDVPFPLFDRQFRDATRPIPVTPDEIDALYARYPAADDGNPLVEYFGELVPGAPYSEAALYVQRGCRGDARCVFCSIPQKVEGRRASMDQVVRVMRQAVADGMQRFVFNDDNFIGDRRWVGEFLRRIEAEGLHRKIRIHVQTRVDAMPIDLLREMRRLGIEFSMGLETMDPARAERLGKVNTGQGARYIAKAQETMRRLAALSVPGDDYYMITVSYGDTLLDVARDTLSQLQMIDELWREYEYVPRFRYNLKQAPYYGDRITAGLSGLPNAQPGSIPVGASPWVTFGQVRGIFDPYGFTVMDGALHATGIFHPMSFVWPEQVNTFFRSFGGNMSDRHLGDIIEALEYALKHSTTLGELGRAELAGVMQQIRVLYFTVKREMGSGNARRLLSSNEAVRERKANDPFGRASGPAIRF